MSGKSAKVSLFSKIEKHPALVAAATTIIIALIGAVCYVAFLTHTYVNKTDSNITEINTRLGGIDAELEKIGTLETKVSSMETDIAVIKNDIEHLRDSLARIESGIAAITPVSYTTIYPKSDFLDLIPLGVPNNLDGNSASILAANPSSLEFSPDTTVATDEAGNELSFGELEGVPFCMNYEDDGLDVWFYGSLNDNGNWDGLCVLNCYSNDELVFLFESAFNNGERIGNYKSVALDSSGHGYNLNNRTYYESYNSGETLVYESLAMPENKFKSDFPVRYSDFSKGKLLSYYSGRTANDRFNDKSGFAYYVSYNEDNTVRTFYQGCFVNGDFVDDRPYDGTENTNSNAFWISLARDESRYWYYIGPFSNGYPKETWREEPIDTSENPADKLPNRTDYPKLSWKTW